MNVDDSSGMPERTLNKSTLPDKVCRICKGPLPHRPKTKRGRPPLYCSPDCAKKGYERKAKEFDERRESSRSIVRNQSRECKKCSGSFIPGPGKGRVPLKCPTCRSG